MLLSRSLLNVSPTQIFGQSQEERNVSGATWEEKKDASHGWMEVWTWKDASTIYEEIM